MAYRIIFRKKQLINTDPQRRCYNGCHFSSKLVWSPWEILHSSVSDETVTAQLNFWKDLNVYAVSQRGEEARCEFIAEKIETNSNN